VRALVDEREERGGEKVWHWVRRGVPLRLEIGPRDIDKDAVFAARRDRAPKDKQSIARTEFVATIANTLQAIQDGLFARAAAYRKEHTRVIDDRDEFYAFFASPRVAEDAPTPIHAGFALTHFSGDVELEKKIKDDLSVTVRCMPLEKSEPGTCPFTGKPSAQRVVWAKAY
jgi:prolyl-tRNA synthetase